MDIKVIATGSRPWQYWVRYWGLSFLVDDTILFDTFAHYNVLARKLQRANVDISKIKTIVISHDHWDHIGGLWQFLEQHPGLDVYLPSSAKEGAKKRIRASGCLVIDGKGKKEVKPGIFMTDEIMGEFNGKPMPEHAVVIESDKGLFVLVGCSHPGILEIVKKAKQLFNAPVFGVIGGFHLMHSQAAEVRMIANGLRDEGIGMAAPTHCTGWRAERIFKDVFRKNYVQLREGQTLTL